MPNESPALLWHFLRLGSRSSRSSGRFTHRRNRRRNRLRLYSLLHQTTSRFWLIRRNVGQRQTSQKEHRRQNRGRATEKVSRTRSTEQTTRSTTTKCGTHICPFAMLHQHQADNSQRHQNMDSQNHGKQPAHLVCLSVRGATNRQKIFCNKSSTTDQTTIDIRLPEQFPRILRFDTATVQNAQPACNFRIIPSDQRTDTGMHVLSLRWRRRPTSTYGPYRLIGHKRITHRSHTNTPQNCQQLPGHHLTRPTCLTLHQGLANTKHRHQPSLPRSREFRCHQSIRFSKQTATLRMPHQHIATTKIHQHFGGNLTSKGSNRMLAQILRTKTNSGPGKQLMRLAKVRIWRTNKHLTGHFSHMRRKLAQQPLITGQVAVHLPVSGD